MRRWPENKEDATIREEQWIARHGFSVSGLSMLIAIYHDYIKQDSPLAVASAVARLTHAH